MLALKLTDIKDFMTKLLRSDIFDHFLLQEADILTGASFVIDGHINKDFYSSEELEALGLTDHKALPFSMLRTQCFDLIKGKKTPSSFKFIFLLSPDNLSRTLASVQSSYTVSDISGMFLNLRYQNQLLLLTTGVSYTIFSTDKSLEAEWDKLVRRFLIQHEIAFEEAV